MKNTSMRKKLLNQACNYFQPMLTKTEDFDTFCRNVDGEMNQFKLEIVVQCIERFDDELRRNVDSLWKIEKRIKRTVVCLFGKITFKRTLFIDEYGRRRYLLDEILGINKNTLFSSDAYIWLVNRAAIVSYGQCVKDFYDLSRCNVSKMTIRRMVLNQAELIKKYGYKNDDILVSQEDLCIESDGIFIAMQSEHRRKKTIKRFLYEQSRNKRSFEIKVGCVYAGKTIVGNTVKREGLSLVASIGNNCEFWDNVSNAICAEYDPEDIKRLWVASDGAKWCKNHILDEAIYKGATVNQSLDMFHVMQAIWRTFSEGDIQDWLVGLVIRRRPEALIKALGRILPQTHKNKRQKIRQLMKYKKSNVELLKAKFNLGTIKATNAYVWAKRMKRFGCAWSKKGA